MQKKDLTQPRWKEKVLARKLGFERTAALEFRKQDRLISVLTMGCPLHA